MINMHHRAARALLLIILALSALGCEGRSSNGITPLRVVMWKPRIPEAWEELFKRFQEKHPDIRIVTEVGPQSSTALHDMLSQRLKNKSTDLDVFFMDVIWPAEFASAGWALSLDEFFPPEERETFLPGPITANTFRGKIYGVPLFMDSGMLFYRKDLLSKYGFQPPRTWPELAEQAKAIMKGESERGNRIYGYTAQFKQYEGLVCNMLEFILSNNGRILPNAPGDCPLEGEEILEALGFVRDRIVRQIAPPGILTYEEPESMDVFIQGKAVFHRNWPYVWEVANDPTRSRVAGRVGTTQLPHFPGGSSHSALGGWQLAISAFSRHKKESRELVRFLASESSQRHLALRAGRLPTLRSLYRDEELLRKMPHLLSMREALYHAHPRPRSPLYPAISNELQYFFHRAISGSAEDLQREAGRCCTRVKGILALEESKNEAMGK